MTQEPDAWLEGTSGEEVGREFKLIEGETNVGRGKESQIQILDPGASREHAVIRFSTGGCVIEDLGSTRGTFVNGEIVQSAELKDGDTIGLTDDMKWTLRRGPSAVDPSQFVLHLEY